MSAQLRRGDGWVRRKRARRDKGRPALVVKGLDAAQGFDYEGKMAARLRKENQLRIGIVGFGNFGQFLAKRFVEQGHHVTATSRSPYEDVAKEIGVAYFRDVNDFCEDHPDVVVFCTSILSLESVLETFPVQRLRRSTLMVDVASVKVFPRHIMLKTLPPEVDILCTHPMFGPDSGQGSWKDLKFMYECVRTGTSEPRQRRLDLFLHCFESEGCRMVNMTCDEHDRLAAGSQFITHTVGRALAEMNLEATHIDTKGFQSLMSLVENTKNDSFDLYYGLFMYNPDACQELARLASALDNVKNELMLRLHSKFRDHKFPSSPPSGNAAAQPPVVEKMSTDSMFAQPPVHNDRMGSNGRHGYNTYETRSEFTMLQESYFKDVGGMASRGNSNGRN